MTRERKKHRLADSTKPNLLEGTFPYSLPPMIHLEGPVTEYIDGRAVEFDFAAVKDRNILISDTPTEYYGRLSFSSTQRTTVKRLTAAEHLATNTPSVPAG
jgi:hypothetical protein